MSWPRGIQSAIFWYASCAPCVEARYEKQRKRDAIRGREMREQLAVEIPNMYRHPSPAATNPHWQTEIDSGPHLTTRGRKYANRDRTRDISKEIKRERAVTQSSDASEIPSSVDLSLSARSGDGRIDSKLYFQQFQRDNEQGPLNAPSSERLPFRSASGMSSRSNITRPTRALMADDPNYVHHRAPQVNDMHPATITKIASKAEAKWLLAPQPTADFMEGRDRSSRSRSDSGGSSRLSGRVAISLSKELSQRMVERRLKDGDSSLVPTLSRGTSSLAPNSPKSQHHDRDNVEEKDFALDDSPKSRPRRPSLLGQSWLPDQSEDSTDTVIRKPDLVVDPPSRLASRPQLSTIDSSGYISSGPAELVPKENIRHSDEFLPERDRISRRAPLTNDETLKAFQELAPHSKIFKSHIVSEQDLTRDSKLHQRRDSDQASGGAEMVDSFYTMDFSSPDWIHEHTKREVKHRWSMDI